MSIQAKAEQHPDKPAIIFGNGETTITYAELEQNSRRLAHVFRALGCEYGDGIALIMGNEDPFYDIYWAAMRSGLYFTPINWHLQEDEVRYIADNCDAKLFIASERFAKVAASVAAVLPKTRARLAFGEIDGFQRIEALLGDVPEDAPLDNQMPFHDKL